MMYYNMYIIFVLDSFYQPNLTDVWFKEHTSNIYGSFYQVYCTVKYMELEI